MDATNPPSTLSDQSYLDGIRRRDNEILSMLYSRYRTPVTAFVLQHGGSEQDGKDVLQESIIAIFLNVQKIDFEFKNSFEAYFLGICRNQWFKKYRSRVPGMVEALEKQLDIAGSPEIIADLEYAERQVFFIETFKKLPESCRKLLTLVTEKTKSSTEIMTLLGMKSLDYYYKRKSICKDHLVALAQSHPHFKQFF